jgi:AcrR family transcriptional regulator
LAAQAEPEMRPRRRRLYERLIGAMVSVTAEKGYAETRVEDVIEEAGVSRFTFYECFSNKEECFLAAYDTVCGRIESRLTAPLPAARPWSERILARLRTALELLSDEPDLAQVALVEVFAAGPDGRARYRAMLESLGACLEQGRSGPPGIAPDRLATMSLGGAIGLIVDELRSESGPDFARLAPDLYFSLLMPYMGPQAAAEATNAAFAVS